jgi:hypothetical protein
VADLVEEEKQVMAGVVEVLAYMQVIANSRQEHTNGEYGKLEELAWLTHLG